ncbi:hypothetical protein TVAGG3_0740700, partial [Trichomonas vaginalis G3]
YIRYTERESTAYYTNCTERLGCSTRCSKSYSKS